MLLLAACGFGSAGAADGNALPKVGHRDGDFADLLRNRVLALRALIGTVDFPRSMLHLLFFLSGIAGLIYQVAWVRQFGNDFGNTVYSAALVTAVFMCGLGLGSVAGGRWADARLSSMSSNGAPALLRAYGAAEMTVAAAGLGLVLLLPHLGGLSAAMSSYAEGAHGWQELSSGSVVLRYGVAIVLIAPPSFLMGATLTLLVRYVLAREVRDAAWRIGTLYGINTAGAAVGALATDLLLIPHAGILRAQVVAVVLNGVVGIGAIALARRSGRGETQAAHLEAPASEGPAPAGARRIVASASLALFLSGFAALGMELLWFRLLSAALGSYRPVFSILLAVILGGIWLGATAGGYCHRRFGRALELFVLAQGLFATVTLALMATFTPVGGEAYARALHTILAVVLAPSFFMGFSFPLANAMVQDTLASVGRRAGSLYLANTIGSVVGSLAAAFVLAPRIGSQASFGIFAACAALAPLPMLLSARSRERATQLAAASSALVFVPALVGWLALPTGHVLDRFLPTKSPNDVLLDRREGANEIVAIVERDGSRTLMTNGHPMSGNTLQVQRYMRAFAHIPLLMTEHPESALVICFGVGNTLHATSLHPSVTRIELADLSRNVLEHAGFFGISNHDVLGDPRVSVFVEDGRQHLRSTPRGSFDLVTLEPPPIGFAGVSSLYSREFYELARSRLKPGGFMTQWLPAYQVPPETVLAMVRAFVDVFPASVLISGYGPELILLGTTGPSVTLDLDAVEARLRERPAVAEDLERVHLGALVEIAGTFVADADAMRRATAGTPAVTDDMPSMEYTYGSTSELPEVLFAPAGVRGFCPKCYDGDTPAARVSWLDDYMGALARLYRDREFRRNQQPVVDGRGIAKTVARSDYLRDIFGASRLQRPPSADWLRNRIAQGNASASDHLAFAYALAQEGRLADATRESEIGVALAPDDPDAHYTLGVLYASTGRPDDAVVQAKTALAIAPSHEKARVMLCTLRPADCAR
jgi:predicted membrane-bound spermidine synthase